MKCPCNPASSCLEITLAPGRSYLLRFNKRPLLQEKLHYYMLGIFTPLDTESYHEVLLKSNQSLDPDLQDYSIQDLSKGHNCSINHGTIICRQHARLLLTTLDTEGSHM